MPKLAALILFLAPAFHSCVEARSPLKAQTIPGWASRQADRAWHLAADRLMGRVQAERARIGAELGAAVKEMPQLDLAEADEAEMQLGGNYGKLPQVIVDQERGAIFPLPLTAPQRYSWFQVAVSEARLLRALGRLDKMLARWKALPGARHTTAAAALRKERGFEPVNALWDAVNGETARLAREIRYLDAWLPQLRPVAGSVLNELFEGEKAREALREALRPRRIMRRSFLPERLSEVPAGIVVLPIATDVTNRRFLAEVEGALDTYWNQSSWARRNGVSFHIRWSFVPGDAAFMRGDSGLAEHLSGFPADEAGLTTGGLTTHVTGQVLVLGPGSIQPRTLAHELGHLLGFDDCYLRTVTGQGPFGMAVLEWDNPFYPDDLMCDNNVGVPRAEAW